MTQRDSSAAASEAARKQAPASISYRPGLKQRHIPATIADLAGEAALTPTRRWETHQPLLYFLFPCLLSAIPNSLSLTVA
jgi:hypothetical protein